MSRSYATATARNGVVTPPPRHLVPSSVPANLSAEGRRALLSDLKARMNRFELESRSLSPEDREALVVSYSAVIRDLERASVAAGSRRARTMTVAEAQSLLDRELAK